MNGVSNEVRKDQENRLSAFSDLITQVSKFSEEMGRMDILRPIYDIISKSEVNPHEVYPSCIAYLQKLKTWLQSQKADYSTITAVENTIRYLKNEEDKIGILA